MRRQGGKTWIVRGLGAALLAVTCGYLPYRLYAQSGLAQLWQLDKDLATLHAKNAGIKSEIVRLEREVEFLRSDPRAVERAARELGYVRPGELLFDVGEQP